MGKTLACMLVAAAGALAAAAPSAAIEGAVRDGAGRGYDGIALELHEVGDAYVRPVRTLVTGTDGIFRAEGLAPGRYAVEFRDGPCARIVALQEAMDAEPAEPHASVAPEPQRREWRAAHARIIATHRGLVTVEPGGTARRDLRVRGRTDVVVTLRDDNGPLDSVPVDLVWANTHGTPPWSHARPQRPATTDRSGRVVFRDIPEGEYEPVVLRAGWAVSYGVHACRGPEPVELALRLSSYTIRLRVVDGGGNPLVGLSPAAFAGSHDGTRVERRGSLLADFDGRYVIPFVPEGEYTVRARVFVWPARPGAGTGRAEVRVGPESPMPVAVIVEGEQTATVLVRAVDRGIPVLAVPRTRVLVERRGDNLAWVQATGGDGIARFELAPGTWLVGRERPAPWGGFAHEPHELNVEAGREYVVDVDVGR